MGIVSGWVVGSKSRQDESVLKWWDYVARSIRIINNLKLLQLSLETSFWLLPPHDLDYVSAILEYLIFCQAGQN